MNSKALVFHGVYWAAAYFLWLSLTTAYHPTWPLRILSTGVLVAASALFSCRFITRELKLKPLMLSAVALIVCGAVAALVISGIYDVLLGPDPRRFALTSNIVMDTAFVFINTIIAAIVATAVSYVTGTQLWRVDQARMKELQG